MERAASDPQTTLVTEKCLGSGLTSDIVPQVGLTAWTVWLFVTHTVLFLGECIFTVLLKSISELLHYVALPLYFKPSMEFISAYKFKEQGV